MKWLINKHIPSENQQLKLNWRLRMENFLLELTLSVINEAYETVIIEFFSHKFSFIRRIFINLRDKKIEIDN